MQPGAESAPPNRCMTRSWSKRASRWPGRRAEDVVVAGALGVIDLSRDLWERVAELCARYADLPLGLVDAGVVALGETAVATLDHRHFRVVRAPARPRTHLAARLKSAPGRARAVLPALKAFR